ncbi:uncharacterized protein LOC110095931 [Dendrobium catenatum]|uniref:uncharacterized protein LOC110095931 n=1 Tax=Dendrobium catenatum TaxID=906689 RepID=UPI0009F32AD6|nr:uncharacterized protein LOC110095931 [Dendrobium catenatum]
MVGISSSTPWGNVASQTQDSNKGFFNLDSEVPSPPKSRSFKDVLLGSSGDTLPYITQTTFNGMLVVLISDNKVLKPVSPFRFMLVGKFGIRQPNLDAIRAFFVLHALGSIFGRPLQTNQATASRTRPSVARVLVEVDITKKHAKEVWVGSKALGYLQKVEFEKFPNFCNHCKSHDHAVSECFKLHSELKKISNNSTRKVGIAATANDKTENLAPVLQDENLSNVEKVGNDTIIASENMMLLDKSNNSPVKDLVNEKHTEDYKSDKGNEYMEECEEGEYIPSNNPMGSEDLNGNKGNVDSHMKTSSSSTFHNVTKMNEEEGSPKMNKKKKKKNGKAPLLDTPLSTRAQANTKSSND